VEIRPIYTKTGNPVVLRSLVEALSRAKRYAWIENPYIYDDSIIRALIKARRRGVDVRVVMPTQADMNSADSNNKVKANRLLSHGVRVYAYPGMLHAKVAVVDGWAILGSCNFNKLSLRMNDESDIATTDPRFVATLNERLFGTDFANSRVLTGITACHGQRRVRRGAGAPGVSREEHGVSRITRCQRFGFRSWLRADRERPPPGDVRL
jgi:cardiolipin synthase A/B